MEYYFSMANILGVFTLILATVEAICNANTLPNVIKSIPGYSGNLPFYLETGYVGVGENGGIQLFYYFVRSESDPARDPLLIWLTGGPGCSAFSGFVTEIGPLMINTSACNWHSKAPVFQLNPFSWTQVASIIFLDAPVGTGFSYATHPEDYYTDDITNSRHIYQFLREWLAGHVGYYNNHLYISGNSYSGMVVPIVVQDIINGNKFGYQPVLNLQGYILGNPTTQKEDFTKSRFSYAHRLSLIPDELYKNIDALNTGHILKPLCKSNQTWCQCSADQLLFYWANNVQVREALNIRKGSKDSWIRCNRTSAYTKNVESTVVYHQNLTKESIRALIYSGDQDLFISYVGTLEWINMLNLLLVKHWRPWFVNNQVAGYTMELSNGHYQMTYNTVKGAGHTASEDKRRECFAMFKKWLTT